MLTINALKKELDRLLHPTQQLASRDGGLMEPEVRLYAEFAREVTTNSVPLVAQRLGLRAIDADLYWSEDENEILRHGISQWLRARIQIRTAPVCMDDMVQCRKDRAERKAREEANDQRLLDTITPLFRVEVAA